MLRAGLSPLHFFRSNRARARARPRARLERVIRPLRCRMLQRSGSRAGHKCWAKRFSRHEDEPEHEHDLGRDDLTVSVRCAEDVGIRREHHIVESLGEHGRCEECDCP